MSPQAMRIYVPLVIILMVGVSRCQTSSKGKKGGAEVSPTTTPFINNPSGVLPPGTTVPPGTVGGVTPGTLPSTAVGSVQSEFPWRTGIRIAPLLTPQENLASRFKLFQMATRTIRYQSFIWQGDETGYLIFEALKAARARGVAVSVLVDEVANLYPESQHLLSEMRAAGISVDGFENFYLDILPTLLTRLNLQAAFDKGNRRRHEKMLIIDGEDPVRAMAQLGGSNVQNRYYQIDPEPQQRWFDADVVVQGQVAQDAGIAFDRDVQRARAALQSATNPFGQLVALLKPANVVTGIIGAAPKLTPDIQNQVRTAATRPLEYVWTDGAGMLLHNVPQENNKSVLTGYLRALATAQREVLIMNSYFVPVPELQRGIRDAVTRGVKVTILTNHPDISDFPAVQIASRALYMNLLTAPRTTGPAPEIYEWGGDKVLHNGVGLHHGKYAVIDRRLLMIGSYNMDPRSEYLNSEGVLALDNPPAAEKMAQRFYKEITPQFARLVTVPEAQSYVGASVFLDLVEQQLGIPMRKFL